MIKKMLGIGTGVAALAAAGVFGYRHYVGTGTQPAAAAAAVSAPQPSRVINLGAGAPPAVPPGRVLIAPVTPKQMPPKMPDLKPPAAKEPAAAPAVAPPAPQPAAPRPGPTIAPARPRPAPGAAATTQPVRGKAAATGAPAPAKKSKVISLDGGPQAGAADTSSTSKLTAQEKLSLALIKQLQQLRGGIATWRSRRGGEVPNFVANPAWEQLLRDQSGRVSGKPPVNPLNGYSRVLPVANDPAPGEAVGGQFGYVFAVGSGRLFGTDAMGRVFDENGVDAVALESRAAREMPAKDQERYLLNTIDAVRGQIALYAAQHDNRPPDFARYPAFEQLMKPTLADGRPAEAGAKGPVYGPYLLGTPINPFNGRHSVATLPGELRPGQRIDRDVGFVFSASTNRLFAVDAAGLVYDDARARAGHLAPEAGGTGSASAGGAATGAGGLKVLRDFLAQYQRHHNGAPPDFKRYPRWEQLTGRTRADGKPDPAGAFGPYLFNVPVNSKNNSSDVDVVGRVARGYKPKKAAGYVFDKSTGQVYLTDELGVVVIDEVADAR